MTDKYDNLASLTRMLLQFMIDNADILVDADTFYCKEPTPLHDIVDTTADTTVQGNVFYIARQRGMHSFVVPPKFGHHVRNRVGTLEYYFWTW